MDFEARVHLLGDIDWYLIFAAFGLRTASAHRMWIGEDIALFQSLCLRVSLAASMRGLSTYPGSQTLGPDKNIGFKYQCHVFG